MHSLSAIALLLLASKSIAAPLQKRQVQVEVVDVTYTAYATVTVPYEAAPAATTTSSSSTKKTHHHPRPTHSSSSDESNIVYVTYTYVNGVPVEATPVASEPAVVTITSTPEPVYVSSTPAPVYSTPEAVTVSSAPASATSATSSTGDSVAQSIVDKHNVYRANHNASPLAWDDSLAAYAAANMPECVMQHTPGGIHGENLSFGYADPVQAVHDWYNEGNQYDYANPGFTETTGHFTQVVWKGTSTIGCHINTECNYMKCEYSAPGNYLGEFAENVTPPITDMYT